MTTHTVPSEIFDSLAAGDGDTLGALRAGQRSKRLLLVHELLSEAESRLPGLFSEVEAAEALAVLVSAQRRCPHAVDALLLQPHVGAWATHCLHDLLTENGIPPADFGHLGAVAAAAALRAGLTFEVTAYIRDGSMMFPTYGLVRLEGSMQGRCRVSSRSGAGGVEISIADATVNVSFDASVGAEKAEKTWLPLRRLHSSAKGVEIDVQLDDLDQYRGCGQLRTTGRLDRTVVEDWQAKLDEAWDLLADHDRPRAEAIAAGVTSFVPLLPSLEKPELSASCHQAVGAVAMTPPQNPVALALALVHEFQHTKLSALLDLVPLFDRSSKELFYAPWRPDPRPLRGLFQGAYAYLGLTGFWELYRHRHGGPHDTAIEDLANFEFAMSRNQVGRTLNTLRRSRLLTPAGERFVEGMKRRSSLFRQLPVPSVPGSRARIASFDHETSWRLRNVLPDFNQVAEWLDAWLAGKEFRSHGAARVTVTDGQGSMPSDGRLALIRHRLGFPTRQHEDVEGASPADFHLVEGQLSDAANAYHAQISRSPDDLASWAGLALARRYLPTEATRALTTCPENVHALHQTMLERTGAAPDVEEVATWIGRSNQ